MSSTKTIKDRVCEVLDCGAIERLGGVAAFYIIEAQWNWYHYVAWTVLIVAALELLSLLTMLYGHAFHGETIPHRGKHLDRLSPLDIAFVVFNKCTTAVFTLHLLQWAWDSPHVLWSAQVNLRFAANVALTIALIFIVYDFFYAIFHWSLHHRSIYKYIHKHHHRQKAPSRGNIDAVNVHPFEFLTGEYNHLLAVYLVGRFVTPVHIATIISLLVVGGVLASLNHTRFDVQFPVFNSVYQVKYHDIHHWYPDSNYGQYTMFWDHFFGWYKPYPTDDKGIRPVKNKSA